MRGEADSNTSSGVTRLELLRWVWPHSEQACVALHSGPDGDKPMVGWVYDAEDAKRAIKAFASGQLAGERFETRTKQGKPYTIEHATRLGLVLHRNNEVQVCCIDLDDHTDDGGNLHQLGPISRFLGAELVVFTSKGGKGLHAFFELGEPMATEDFVRWAKRWGFNRDGQPEMFPKSTGPSHVLMPGEPNELGGDTYRSGTIGSALINHLPEPPPVDLTTKTLRFLRGEVPQPGRNDALNTAALELGQKMVERSAAWALCERGARLCGLEPGETGRTFESGYGDGLSQSGAGISPFTRQKSSSSFESDGIGHAERFAMMHRDHARYCVQENDWYVYKTNRWVRSSVEAQAMAKETARTIEDQSVRRKASSKHGVKEILFLASSEPGISVSASDFDGDPMLFNCQSGVIDLRSGTIRRHTPRDLMRHYSAVRYSPDKDCPLWVSFLEVVCGGDQELIGYLQRVCGYLLTGDVSEQCLFFLLGDGCNGKSVFASVLQHIIGSYAVRVPAELLMRPPRGGQGGPTPDAARLMGSRLAVSTELEEGRRFAEVRIKELTGGDRQVARPLYGHPVEFDPTHKLLLFGNHTPEIVNNDEGIWRRMRLVPFNVTIDKHRRDPHLIDKLMAESDAILGWMVQGCVRWHQEGLGVPEAVRRATSGYRYESDAVGRFIEECCERVPGVELLKAVLYARYKAWCECNGEHAISPKALFPRMEKLGIKDGRRGSIRFWKGLVIREDEP